MSAGMSLTGGSEIYADTHLILWTEGNFHPGRHYYRDFVKIGVSGPSSSFYIHADRVPAARDFWILFPPIYTSVDGNVCLDELTGGSETSPVVHLISHPGRHYYQDFLKIGVSGPSSSLIYTGDLSPPPPLGFFWERARHCIITRTEGNLTSSRQTLLSRFYVKLAYQDPLVPYIYAGDLSPPLGRHTGPRQILDSRRRIRTF